MIPPPNRLAIPPAGQWVKNGSRVGGVWGGNLQEPAGTDRSIRRSVHQLLELILGVQIRPTERLTRQNPGYVSKRLPNVHPATIDF